MPLQLQRLQKFYLIVSPGFTLCIENKAVAAVQIGSTLLSKNTTVELNTSASFVACNL